MGAGGDGSAAAGSASGMQASSRTTVGSPSSSHSSSPSRCFQCGIVAGGLQAGLFNPFDRALFLMHLHKRPFLTRANFHRPYEGFHQSVLHRVFSGGMFFPIEQLVLGRLPESYSPVVASTVAGMASGSVIAVVTNPLASTKYQSWGSSHRGHMLKTARDMLKRGGVQAFTRAMHLTLLRDIVWGGTYALLRHWLPEVLQSAWQPQEKRQQRQQRRQQQLQQKPQQGRDAVNTPGLVSFASNMIAGGCGTMLSSPLNYARNIRYGHNVAHDPKSLVWIVRDLMKDANAHHAAQGTSRVRFVVGRLAIGWGTLRVALGLAFSSQVYLGCLNLALPSS